jgi:protein TonB
VTEAVLHSPPGTWLRRAPWIFLAASLALHAGLLVWVSSVPPAPPHAGRPASELVVVEVTRPSPAPEVKPATPPPAPPPARIKRFRAAVPPPNDVPLPQPAAEPPPVVVGLTMQSTTTAGSYAAPVGNTLAAKAPERATAPAEVQPPVAAPLYEVDSQPTVIGEVKIPYPEEARARGLEGRVVLRILVDETGQVRSVKLVSGPGGGLDEAATKAVARFRFRPAMRKGQPVATEIRYAYTFELD